MMKMKTRRCSRRCHVASHVTEAVFNGCYHGNANVMTMLLLGIDDDACVGLAWGERRQCT